jgi:hypothetical protein
MILILIVLVVLLPLLEQAEHVDENLKLPYGSNACGSSCRYSLLHHYHIIAVLIQCYSNIYFRQNFIGWEHSWGIELPSWLSKISLNIWYMESTYKYLKELNWHSFTVLDTAWCWCFSSSICISGTANGCPAFSDVWQSSLFMLNIICNWSHKRFHFLMFCWYVVFFFFFFFLGRGHF